MFTVLIALGGTQISKAQFPKECMNATILQTKKCCPDECGSKEGRGMCGSVDLPKDLQEESSVRNAWPYYFNHVCICNHNFSGYNCGRCKYGHYGESCNNSKIVERRPISDCSPQEWKDYMDILAMTKKHYSDHMVFLEEPQSSNSDPSQLPQSNITLYDLFVWQHHYPAKDSENEGRFYNNAH